MKKTICLIFLLVFALIFSGCSSFVSKTNVDRALDLKENSNITESETELKFGLSFDVKNVSPTGATIYFTQSGGEVKGVLQTGKDFKLEKLDDGKWKKIQTEKEPNWDMSAIAIIKDERTKIEIDWEWIYGELPAGKYRLSKDVTDYKDIKDYEIKTYSYIFEIK